MKMKLIVTIFGATGDLATRKLLPALSNLIKNNEFASDVTVLAVGRRPFNKEDYIHFVREQVNTLTNLTPLANELDYVKVDVTNEDSFSTLKNKITALSSGYDRVKKIFYFAVSPNLFAPIAQGLSKFKIAEKGDADVALAFEKPFGLNFEDAETINELVTKYFDESQIFRVDHYLGKEMIQNLLTLRFANIKYASLWKKEFIDEVKIFVSEEEGILKRGNYYDQVGVLSDMVQSHLLQIVALVAMEAPDSLASHDVKEAKLNVLKNITVDLDHVILGQYASYLTEKGVKPDSSTPTLAFLKLNINTPLFAGVPFYIYTGKKLAKKEAYIEIIFKKPVTAELFDEEIAANTLRIYLAPEAKIVHTLNGKQPGYEQLVEQTAFEYCYTCVFPNNVKEAYEKLFLEMVLVHKSLFPVWEEILYAWKIVAQIKSKKLLIYEDGYNLEEQ